jgi:hypothetical protein
MFVSWKLARARPTPLKAKCRSVALIVLRYSREVMGFGEVFGLERVIVDGEGEGKVGEDTPAYIAAVMI